MTANQIVRRLEQLEERTGARDDVPELVIEVAFIGADGRVTGTIWSISRRRMGGSGDRVSADLRA